MWQLGKGQRRCDNLEKCFIFKECNISRDKVSTWGRRVISISFMHSRASQKDALDKFRIKFETYGRILEQSLYIQRYGEPERMTAIKETTKNKRSVHLNRGGDTINQVIGTENNIWPERFGNARETSNKWRFFHLATPFFYSVHTPEVWCKIPCWDK